MRKILFFAVAVVCLAGCLMSVDEGMDEGEPIGVEREALTHSIYLSNCASNRWMYGDRAGNDDVLFCCWNTSRSRYDVVLDEFGQVNHYSSKLTSSSNSVKVYGSQASGDTIYFASSSTDCYHPFTHKVVETINGSDPDWEGDLYIYGRGGGTEKIYGTDDPGGSTYSVRLHGDSSVDYLYSGGALTYLTGYESGDLLSCASNTAERCYIYGGDGDDLILGGDGGDYIWAGDGDDYILADSGTDYCYGQGGTGDICNNCGSSQHYTCESWTGDS